MSAPPKILLLDDEPDLLEYYREILLMLKSKPEITTCDSGARAIALLDAEPYSMLISDLKMPKMDGLQVLSIVRRKFPLLRVVILTGVPDEQLRSRAYAMGVDLFWEKPTTPLEIKLFTECIESLLGAEIQGGFRGIQSKSLVDLIQLECLSQNSCVLRISNGKLVGRIWIMNGELIDAATGRLAGEEAFKEIFGWRTGNFEMLPPDPERPRRIVTSYQGLLLDSAQSLDEAQVTGEEEAEPMSPALTRLSKLARFEGVEFLAESQSNGKDAVEGWAIDNPEDLMKWTSSTYERFNRVGEMWQLGPLREVEGFGSQRHIATVSTTEKLLCVGFRRALSSEEIRETMKKINAKWIS